MNTKDWKLSTLLTMFATVALVIIFYGPHGPETYTADTLEQVRSLTRRCSLEEQGHVQVETIWKNMGKQSDMSGMLPGGKGYHEVKVPIGWSVTCYPGK